MQACWSEFLLRAWAGHLQGNAGPRESYKEGYGRDFIRGTKKEKPNHRVRTYIELFSPSNHLKFTSKLTVKYLRFRDVFFGGIVDE